MFDVASKTSRNQVRNLFFGSDFGNGADRQRHRPLPARVQHNEVAEQSHMRSIRYRRCLMQRILQVVNIMDRGGVETLLMNIYRQD